MATMKLIAPLSAFIDLYSRVVDQQAFDLPKLENVFAAGNSGNQFCGPSHSTFILYWAVTNRQRMELLLVIHQIMALFISVPAGAR